MTRRQPHGHPANSVKYKTLRAEFMRKQGRFGWCALCGKPVDMTLSGRTALGPSVDHIVATTAGGSWFDPGNWQLAHLECNNKKGRGVSLGVARPSGAPVPGDPRFCWVQMSNGWEHVLPAHGFCDWPGCMNAIHE